jgi:4-diphosphocytidyl-2C-methyl-D-erythritol kinase
MTEDGALGTLLAGSGLSVFGIFIDNKGMQQAMEKLQKGGIQCFMTETVS